MIFADRMDIVPSVSMLPASEAPAYCFRKVHTSMLCMVHVGEKFKGCMLGKTDKSCTDYGILTAEKTATCI